MTIRTDLLPHQARIVKFGSPLEYFGMFSSFGTGKSLAALSIVQVNRWKLVLIISTKTAIESTWPEQIKEHTNFFYSTLIGDSNDKLKTLYHTIDRYWGMVDLRGNRPVMILLINFDGVKGIFKELLSVKFDAVIVDELTKGKHASTIRSKVLWALGKHIPRRIGMTGFPVTENLTEIYSQIKFLDRGKAFGNSEAKFLHEYFTKKKGKYVPKEGAAEKIFSQLKEFCIMVPETVVKLPPKVRNRIGLEPTDEQKKYLAMLNGEFKEEFSKLKINVNSIYALWVKASQVCNGFIRDSNGRIKIIDTPKDEALFEILEKIGRKNKALIWTTDVWTLKKIYHLSKHFDYKMLLLYGKTKDAGLIVKQFQKNPAYSILGATIQKANESITLTNCRYSIHYNPGWSNDKKSNADARNRRIGSEKWKSLFQTELFIKGSIEEVMINCVDEKQNFLKELKKYFA